MEKYLNKGIKEIISQFPEVAEILNKYNIGCVPCNVGTCLLKDVVEIHNLPEDEEQELMIRIAKAVYPDRDIKIPKITRKPKSRELKYSPPIKKLVDEHVLIKRLIALIPGIIENMDLSTKEGRQLVLDSVDFIRSYADKYHHAKEEDILFKYFDQNLDIVKTMLTDHEAGRSHVRCVVEGAEKQDKMAVAEHLNAYKELLTEHIKKEDEILYPWMDRGLTVSQIGGIYQKFNEADKNKGEEVPERSEKFIVGLEEKFKKAGVPRNRKTKYSCSGLICL